MSKARIALSTFAALGLGSCTAAIGAKVAENMVEPPEFSMKNDRFDLTSFKGRYFKMLSNNDPSTLLRSSEAVSLAQMKLIPDNMAKYSKQELWEARKLVESSLHPDTKDLVPHPFRMAGYVPFNGPICAAMMSTTSTFGLLFWNWVNQSQNALVNYFNRNASSEMSNETLMKSYLGAVTAALSVALGLSFAIRKSCQPETAAKLMKFIAFPSSMVASSSNCYIMRKPEIDTGIEVFLENNEVLGENIKSKNAATKAVLETVYSRALLQIPVFLGPALIMSTPFVSRLVMNKATSWLNIPLMSFVTMVCFSFGLPAAIAVFPQQGVINVTDLETEFQDLDKLKGNPTVPVYYNKGL